MAVEAQLCYENMGLPGSLDWVLSSVMGIDDDVFFFQEPPQQAPLMHQSFQFIGLDTNLQGTCFSSNGHSLFSMEFTPFLASELEKQTLEMDQYLHFQNERLRRVLHEESRQQAVMLHRYESSLRSLMTQKDEDLANATKRRMELQDWLRRAEVEAKAWQRKSMENESLVVDLHKKLNECNNGVQDSESICEGGNGDEEGIVMKKKMGCKVCHVRSSCVLFLPCRHLCSCKSCEAVLGFCPVCESVKKASMEVFLV